MDNESCVFKMSVQFYKNEGISAEEKFVIDFIMTNSILGKNKIDPWNALRFNILRSEFRYFLAKFDHDSTFVELKHPI